MTTTTTNVTVINRGLGTIEVHKPSCGDLKRNVVGASVWTVEASSFKDVVLDVYPPSDFEYDESDWENYPHDLVVMPCAPSLDGRATKRNAEWARQYRQRIVNRYPVLITME